MSCLWRSHYVWLSNESQTIFSEQYHRIRRIVYQKLITCQVTNKEKNVNQQHTVFKRRNRASAIFKEWPGFESQRSLKTNNERNLLLYSVVQVSWWFWLRLVGGRTMLKVAEKQPEHGGAPASVICHVSKLVDDCILTGDKMIPSWPLWICVIQNQSGQRTKLKIWNTLQLHAGGIQNRAVAAGFSGTCIESNRKIFSDTTRKFASEARVWHLCLCQH